MSYYFIKTGMVGATGDLFKAKDMETAAEKAAKRWPRASRLYVWEVVEDTPTAFEPQTEVQVTGVRKKDF